MPAASQSGYIVSLALSYFCSVLRTAVIFVVVFSQMDKNISPLSFLVYHSKDFPVQLGLLLLSEAIFFFSKEEHKVIFITIIHDM